MPALPGSRGSNCSFCWVSELNRRITVRLPGSSWARRRLRGERGVQAAEASRRALRAARTKGSSGPCSAPVRAMRSGMSRSRAPKPRPCPRRGRRRAASRAAAGGSQSAGGRRAGRGTPASCERPRRRAAAASSPAAARAAPGRRPPGPAPGRRRPATAGTRPPERPRPAAACPAGSRAANRRSCSSRVERHDVLVVEPVELGLVEDGRARREAARGSKSAIRRSMSSTSSSPCDQLSSAR